MPWGGCAVRVWRKWSLIAQAEACPPRTKSPSPTRSGTWLLGTQGPLDSCFSSVVGMFLTIVFRVWVGGVPLHPEFQLF